MKESDFKRKIWEMAGEGTHGRQMADTVTRMAKEELEARFDPEEELLPERLELKRRPHVSTPGPRRALAPAGALTRRRIAMIEPTVGRIVHYFGVSDAPTPAGIGPLAAVITAVHGPNCVNLAVFDGNGHVHSRTSVTLVQPGHEAPANSYCTWMPYQVKKTTGSESGERTAGIAVI